MNKWKEDDNNIDNSQMNNITHQKISIFESLVKIVQVLLQLEFFLIREIWYNHWVPSSLTKLNPSLINKGSIYTNYGLLLSLKILTIYYLHDNKIADIWLQINNIWWIWNKSSSFDVQLSLETGIGVFDWWLDY